MDGCSTLGTHYSLAAVVTTLSAGLQALANAYGIVLIYSAGSGETRTLAGAVCFAGILESALSFSAHRGAAIARITVYGGSVFLMVFQEWVRAGRWDASLTYDFASILFLLYVCWIVVRRVIRTPRNGAPPAGWPRLKTPANAHM